MDKSFRLDQDPIPWLVISLQNLGEKDGSWTLLIFFFVLQGSLERIYFEREMGLSLGHMGYVKFNDLKRFIWVLFN